MGQNLFIYRIIKIGFAPTLSQRLSPPLTDCTSTALPCCNRQYFRIGGVCILNNLQYWNFNKIKYV